MIDAWIDENAVGSKMADVTAGGTPVSSEAMDGGGRIPASIEEIWAKMELETEAGLFETISKCSLASIELILLTQLASQQRPDWQ